MHRFNNNWDGIQRKTVAEASWSGGGFQSSADAHRGVQAGLKADANRERDQKLKMMVQVIRGEITKQQFKKSTGSNFDDLMNASWFKNQIKRMPKKALQPVAKKEEVEIPESQPLTEEVLSMKHFTEMGVLAKDIMAYAKTLKGKKNIGGFTPEQATLFQIAGTLHQAHQQQQDFLKGLIYSLEGLQKMGGSSGGNILTSVKMKDELSNIIRELKKYKA